MTNRLKTLMPLCLLLLASSATAASTANASKVTVANEKYPAVVTGSQEGSKLENYFETTPGMRTHCATATGEATLTGPSGVVLVTPHLAGCIATLSGLEIGLTFDLNGCTFTAIAGENTSTTDVDGSVEVTCPAGKKITITAATCQVHIYPQLVSSGLTLTNLASGQLTATSDITGKLHYEDTDGFLCPFSGNTTATNGGLTSRVLITGYNDEGQVEDPVTPGTIDHKHSPTEVDIHVK